MNEDGASPPRILVVEDERIVAFNLQQRLSKLGYGVPAIASSGMEALQRARETRPDLVLMDIRIDGDIDGIETASMLPAVHEVPVVYLTAHAEEATLSRARATRPYGYLLKPFSELELHATLQMALERRKVEIALRQSEERQRLALDAAQMGIFEIDLDKEVIELEPRAAGLMGLDPSTHSTTWEHLLSNIAPEHRDNVRGELESDFNTAASVRTEFPLQTDDGVKKWRRIHAKSIALDGRRSQVIGVVEDISEERHIEETLKGINADLEQRVADRTRALSVRNEYLDSFNRSVAHDLRAPIRHIRGFTDLLLEDAAMAGEADRRKLIRIRDSAEHLDRMIVSLLMLSERSQVILKRVRCDLSAMVDSAARRLRESAPERQVRVEIEPGLETHADVDLIEDVLDNLLDNAWKYTSRRELAVIEFGCTPTANGPAFFVRDNGVGFMLPTDSASFHPFKRFHSAGEYPGTGIGLSSAQRIIEGHGGRLWADTTPDQGTTIFFTLPGNDD